MKKKIETLIERLLSPSITNDTNEEQAEAILKVLTTGFKPKDQTEIMRILNRKLVQHLEEEMERSHQQTLMFQEELNCMTSVLRIS